MNDVLNPASCRRIQDNTTVRAQGSWQLAQRRP